MRKIYEHQCSKCDKNYTSNFYRGSICTECKINTPLCKCGCGEKVKKHRDKYIVGHYHNSIKGLSLEERFGTKDYKNGYQKGEANIAKRKDIRIKISKGVKKSYTPELIEKRRKAIVENLSKKNTFAFNETNSRGMLFRSKLEVAFSEILIKNNIEFQTEYPFRNLDNSLKVIDFKIGDIFVEITGYAIKDWKERFDKQIPKLRQSTSNPILIISYENNIERLKEKMPNYDLMIASIKNEELILKHLKFSKILNLVNSKI